MSEPLTYEPRHRCPSHSRGGVAEPTGEDTGQEKAEDRRRGQEGSQTHPGIGQSSGFTMCLPKAVTEGTFSRTSTASSHTPDTWELCLSGWKSLMVKPAQWQRCQEPTGQDLNSSCEKQNGCFPSLLESYRDRRKAGVCPFPSLHLFHSSPWNLRASKGAPTTGYDFTENYPGHLPNPIVLRFGSAVWAVRPSRLGGWETL